MNKLQTVIKENLDKYITKIIQESNIDILEMAKNEFLESLQNNPLTLTVGKGELEIQSSNFTFYIDYILQSNAYYDNGGGNYDEEPWSETYNEDKYEVTHFNVTAIDEETNMEIKFVPDNKMFQIIKSAISVDYSKYDNMPNKEEYFNQY